MAILNGYRVKTTDKFLSKKPCYCRDAITGQTTSMGKKKKSDCKKACKDLRPTKFDTF
jgi:hypothetical protein